MNRVAHAELVLGKPALERTVELVAAVGDDLALWLEGDPNTTLNVGVQDGYLVLTWAGEEGAFSEAARAVGGFALETGPDSGGPGWATDGEEEVLLTASGLEEAAELYRRWKGRTPPVGERALAAFKEALEAALSKEKV